VSTVVSQVQPLMARDGHTFSVYMANPNGRASAAVIILQEIFGVTPWIRRVADSYAAAGYLAVAPALFDRVHRRIELGYSAAETEEGKGYRAQIALEEALLDIAACAAVIRHAGRVAIVGFCWGGTLSWSAASSLRPAAAVCYYGAGMLAQTARPPACPTLLHFAQDDPGIPASEVDQLRDAFPQGEFHLYPARHGFANEDRPDRYDAVSAALARTRTHEFLARALKSGPAKPTA
jgi:carboxymethylenebutenolidase